MEVRKGGLVIEDIRSSEVGLSSVHCACHVLRVTLNADLLIELPTEKIIHHLKRINFSYWYPLHVPGSSVGIVADYGLDGPGIESWWRRDFSHTSRPSLKPTQPPVQWVPGLSWG
jgi:hypothetical protein